MIIPSDMHKHKKQPSFVFEKKTHTHTQVYKRIFTDVETKVEEQYGAPLHISAWQIIFHDKTKIMAVHLNIPD